MDWIVFLISAAVLIFLHFKNKPSEVEEVKHEEKNEVRPEEPRENPLHEFLQAFEEREKKREQHQAVSLPPKPKPIQRKQERIEGRHLVSPLRDKKLISETEKRHLSSPLKTRTLKSNLNIGHDGEVIKGSPRAHLVMNRLKHKQDFLIYHEIFGKPKSLE